MVDPSAPTLTERQSTLVMADGRIRLNDAAAEVLGGVGAWINVDVIDGAVVLRPSTLHPDTVEALHALQLDNDES